jgi:hypothetical protein
VILVASLVILVAFLVTPILTAAIFVAAFSAALLWVLQGFFMALVVKLGDVVVDSLVLPLFLLEYVILT